MGSALKKSPGSRWAAPRQPHDGMTRAREIPYLDTDRPPGRFYAPI